MDSYTHLPDQVESPTDMHVAPPFPTEYGEEAAEEETSWAQSAAAAPSRWAAAAAAWWQNAGWRSPPPPYVAPSGYLTLIPLSDDRLKPRRTKLTVLLLFLTALLLVAGVFVLVPRGVSTGEIRIFSDDMSWNSTKGTYQLDLLAKIPIYNPNYFTATIEGRLAVYFYDTLAGEVKIASKPVKARALPDVLHVQLDASNVPDKYALTILSECAAFPRRLIFFLKAELTARHLLHTQSHLSDIDSYFMIDCVNGGSVPSPDGGQSEQTANSTKPEALMFVPG